MANLLWPFSYFNFNTFIQTGMEGMSFLMMKYAMHVYSPQSSPAFVRGNNQALREFYGIDILIMH